MPLLEFLELIEVSYEKFSKDKAKLLKRWTTIEPSLKIEGVGKDATISAKSFDVFYFKKHAREKWGIDGGIDYRILYEIYKIILDTDGKYLMPYWIIGNSLGVHPNTIGKYINILNDANIIRKQVIFEVANRKRIKALPTFHEEFKASLLNELPPEIDWFNHRF